MNSRVLRLCLLALFSSSFQRVSQAQAFVFGSPIVPQQRSRAATRRASTLTMGLFGNGWGQVIGPLWLPKKVLNGKTPKSTQGPAEEDVPAGEIAERLMSSTKTLFASFSDGVDVNYKGLAESKEWAEYIHLTDMLQTVKLGDLSEDERKAFFLNTYNSLIWHAIVLRGSDIGGMQDRLRMYALSSYRIGGLVYSLNDIENGVLRGNKPSAAPGSKPPFREGDERLAFMQKTLDPRIHFALNCGAKSCPPIRFYSGEKVNDQLDVATKAFCRALPIQEGGHLQMSQIFKWYADDFGGEGKPQLTFAANFLGEEEKALVMQNVANDTFKVLYEPYDWSLNGKSS